MKGSVEQCKAECRRRSDCQLFNIYKKTSTCWFKSVKRNQGFGKWEANKAWDNYEKVGGSAPDSNNIEGKYTKYPNQRLKLQIGPKVIGALKSSPAVCMMECMRRPGCKLFNYWKKNNTCYFKAAGKGEGYGKWENNQYFDAYARN